MLHFLGEISPVLSTIIDVLGIAGILVFGIFVLVFVTDVLLSSSSKSKGIFFNKNSKETEVTYENTPAPQDNSGVVYYNSAPQPEPAKEAPVEAKPETNEVDFDKAIEEQKMLNSKNEPKREPIATFDDFDDEDEDINEIIEDVTKQALKELSEAEVKEEVVEKPKKVYKVKTLKEQKAEMEQPVEEQPLVVEEPVENEEIKRLEAEREELAKKLAELEELRKQDHEELLGVMEELKSKEPIIVDKNKEEEEKRKFANIARMNARLNSIKRNTEKLENAPKEKPQKVKTIVVEEEIVEPEEEVKEEVVEVEVYEEQPVVEKIVTVEKVIENKPRFKKEYYENRLNILEQELKDAEKELKANKKEYAPLTKVKKAYERDSQKLRRKEMVVAKQKVALYGVGNANKKINPDKKAKLDENVKQLKELKDSVFHCEQVIEQNKDRFPILEKNNKLLTKQVKRLQDDINSVNEALAWFETHNENEE